jgi:predicted CXXCH cytochrome family protein
MTEGRPISRWRKLVIWLVVVVLGAGGVAWLLWEHILNEKGEPVVDVVSPAPLSPSVSGSVTTAPVVPATLEVDDTVKPSAALDAQMAKDPDRAPTHKSLNCTTGECHAKETKHKVLHVPFAQGACETCHVSTSIKRHEFHLRAQGGELCTFCHIGGGGSVGAVQHKPFERGECLSCHSPHGGEQKVILRTADLSGLCATCHQDITKGRHYLHGPVQTGSCVACHAAHRSAEPKLLAASGRDLCLSCHDTMRSQITNVLMVHKPAQGDCRECHEVHASDHKKQLKAEPEALCISCHDKVGSQIASATVKHSPVKTGDACLNCHTPHGGNLSKLMKAEPIVTCLGCHKEPIQTADSRIVPSMAILADPNQNKHGPIREGDCAGCHTAHGATQPHLLAKPYSSEFYQAFAEEKYELCFSCHDRQLVLLPQTTGLTGFRNGEKNLHYLHVNKSEKGRNCRACHSTHSSTLPLHIRESVPYGNWELPIGFKKTETGGACQSACHKEYRYDRDKPVVNPVATP